MSASVLEPQTADRRALAEARTVDEVRSLRDKAAAVLVYVRRQRQGLDAQNSAAEIKLRCERKLGDLLTETVRARGRCLRDESTGQVNGAARTLPDSVTATQSHRWRRVASVPEHVFEAWLAETRERCGELTTAGLLALATNEPDDPMPEIDDLGGDGADGAEPDDAADVPPPPPPPPGLHTMRLAYSDADWREVTSALSAARRRFGTPTESATILALLRDLRPE